MINNENKFCSSSIIEWLTTQIAHELNVKKDMIDIRQPFSRFNIDSVRAMLMLSKIQKDFDLKLSPTIFWNYPTIQALADRLEILAKSKLDHD